MSELNFIHSNGNKVKLTTPDTLGADKTFKLPGADGSSGQFLKTDGSGALSFATPSDTNTIGPLFRAYLSPYQVVAHNTNTQIIFQNENFDTDSCYNTTNGRFTPNKAGYYILTAQLQFSNATSNYRYITRMLKNGTVIGRQDSWNDGSNGENHNRASTIVTANGSSDYFTAEGYQGSGGNITITASDAGTYFEAHFIRGL